MRYRLLDSIRAYAAERLREAGQRERGRARRTPRGSPTGPPGATSTSAAARQPACLAIARAERANVDAALAWCAAHDPALGVRIAIGFGWTWVVLGDGTAGAARVRDALTPDDAVPRPGRRRCCSPAGWRRRPATSALAQADLDARTGRSPRSSTTSVLLADVDRHRAFLAIQQGRPDEVLVHAAAALGDVTGRSGWPGATAGSLLLAAYGVADARRHRRRDPGRDRGRRAARSRLGDSWGMVHAEAMLGGIAQAEHRFDDAARALARAADESATLGFLGQAALHRATLGAGPAAARRPGAPRRRTRGRSTTPSPAVTAGWPRRPG